MDSRVQREKKRIIESTKLKNKRKEPASGRGKGIPGFFEGMRTVLKYPGAKNRIAGRICGHMPRHKVYLEPYAGSLAVLFNKTRSHIETVNDRDEEICNYFRVLRDRKEDLTRLIKMTPYSRTEYVMAYERTDDEVERARRFCVRCWMGFGCGNLYMNGFKAGQQTNSPNPAKTWSELPQTLYLAAERLKGVQIENLPALELISRYDTPDVFIYADPPYLRGTRKAYLYKHEMEDTEHEQLLEALLKHPGKIMISGYENSMYDTMLKGWRKESIRTQAESGLKRTEVIWMNYQEDQMSIEDFPEVMP